MRKRRRKQCCGGETAALKLCVHCGETAILIKKKSCDNMKFYEHNIRHFVYNLVFHLCES